MAATRLTVWPPLASTPLPLSAAAGPDPVLLPQLQARPRAPARLPEVALRGIFLPEDPSPGLWGAPGSIFGLPLPWLGLTGQWVREGLAAAPGGRTTHRAPAHRATGASCLRAGAAGAKSQGTFPGEMNPQDSQGARPQGRAPAAASQGNWRPGEI